MCLLSNRSGDEVSIYRPIRTILQELFVQIITAKRTIFAYLPCKTAFLLEKEAKPHGLRNLIHVCFLEIGVFST